MKYAHKIMGLGLILAVSSVFPAGEFSEQQARVYGNKDRIVLETLPLRHLLVSLQETVKKMCPDAPESESIMLMQNAVEQGILSLTSIVDAFNHDILYEYGDLKDDFLDLATCVGEFEQSPEPFLIRNTKKLAIHLEKKIIDLMAIRAAFLSSNQKKILQTMSQFNQLLTGFLLNEDYFSSTLLETLDDYLICRPIEFAQDHPVLVGSAIVIIAALVYYFWLHDILWAKQTLTLEEQEKEVHKWFKEKQCDFGSAGLHVLMLKMNGKTAEECKTILEQYAQQEIDQINGDIDKKYQVVKQAYKDVCDRYIKDLKDLKSQVMTREEFETFVKKEPEMPIDAQVRLHAVFAKDIKLPSGTYSVSKLIDALERDRKAIDNPIKTEELVKLRLFSDTYNPNNIPVDVGSWTANNVGQTVEKTDTYMYRYGKNAIFCFSQKKGENIDVICSGKLDKQVKETMQKILVQCNDKNMRLKDFAELNKTKDLAELLKQVKE